MKILVADDNETFLYLVAEVLKSHGHEVLMARDGKEAREILSEENVELIISDVNMPELDGARFQSYVRELLSNTDVPFIFVSGYTNPYQFYGIEKGPNDYYVAKENAVLDLMQLVDSFENQANKSLHMHASRS